MKLSEVAIGKDNNFNLIRFLAAFAVLVSHCFAIAGRAEPLHARYGLTWGMIAVDVFFLTSGFLVTASLLSRGSATSYIWARVLRIAPALWVMLAISVFGVGLKLTTSTTSGYLMSHQTWKYLLKNATLLKGIEYTLPGVFAQNPSSAINGSLWSLRPEVYMYLLLLGAWIVCARSAALLKWTLPILTAVLGVVYLYHGKFQDIPLVWNLFALGFMFFTGASFYLFRHTIELSRSFFFAFLSVVLLCALNRVALFFALSLSLSYLVFYTAYGFRGRTIRLFNLVGDYSYGLYIYAFVTGQVIECLVPGVSVAKLIGTSSAFTLLLALFSWHLIEKRALALKDACNQKTLALLGRQPAVQTLAR